MNRYINVALAEYVPLLVIAAATIGCAQLTEVKNTSAEKAAAGINTYCANVDEQYRQGFRDEVNSRTEGHTVVITCAE